MYENIYIGGIITSRIDSSYYVMSHKNYLELETLKLVLEQLEQDAEQKESYSNIITEYITKANLKEQKDKKIYSLFIEKNSDFGNLLTHLIEEKILVDERYFIKKSTIINAIINEAQKKLPNLSFIETLFSLIRENEIGNIDELSKKYYVPHLNMAIIRGNSQTYMNGLSFNLDGYEREGYLYHDNSWYEFDIVKKSYHKKKKENKIKEKIKK